MTETQRENLRVNLEKIFRVAKARSEAERQNRSIPTVAEINAQKLDEFDQNMLEKMIDEAVILFEELNLNIYPNVG